MNNYDDRFLSMTWNEMAIMIEALEERVADLKSTVRHLEQVIAAVDDQQIVTDLKDDVAGYAIEANNWYQIACGLYDAVLIVEEQLNERGIGIRPAAQQAMRQFEEYEDEQVEDEQ